MRIRTLLPLPFWGAVFAAAALPAAGSAGETELQPVAAQGLVFADLSPAEPALPVLRPQPASAPETSAVRRAAPADTPAPPQSAVRSGNHDDGGHPDQGYTLYAQAAASQHRAHSESIGVMLPLGSLHGQWGGMQWSALIDLSAGRLTSHPEAKTAEHPDPVRRRHTAAVAAVPTLRISRPDGRLFLDIGAGVMLTDRYYSNHGRRLSTRYNFATHIGPGVWLGSGRNFGVQLRVQHISNAGIKHPNPGENFYQIRFLQRFR